MEKSEFENQIREYGFVKLVSNEKAEEIDRYIDTERLDMYTIYKNKKEKYVVLFKSIERAVAKRLAELETQSEAFEFLIKDLQKSKNKKEDQETK